MYDIGLDAYKHGKDSIISEDKHSTIKLTSRNVTTKQTSLKGLEQFEVQNNTEHNSNYGNLI